MKASDPSRQAVIFDFDGVMVDTESYHAEAWEITFRNQGLAVTREQCFPAVELEDHVFVSAVLQDLGIKADPREWVREKQAVFRQLLDQIKVYPGVVELVQALALKYPLAIVSSAWTENINTLIHQVGLKSHFSVIVGKETVSVHKPAPDGYLKAAELLKLPPSNCVVLEDSPSGIRSAKAAGMKCIGVAHRQNPEQLQEADHVVPNLVNTQNLLQLLNHHPSKFRNSTGDI